MLRFFIILAIITALEAQRKAGVCPNLFGDSNCEISCYNDFHCEDNLKCCKTTCGGTSCVSPIKQQISSNKKPGFCPTTPTGPWVCSSRCSLDSDCRGKKKCCKNRCGAMACTSPQN